ncbi:hypothetical protein MAR_003938 [Mya arenaria]|uniref:Uncharacterized protein n=1 Tax=Mya arenaria TaxID=6604 RepID=A0ABY7EV70_MYAAR|nr:hypothetical protein MAR_003938 [Mya arenaria]
MGVRGLLSTCLKDSDACTYTYDLVQVAQQHGGLELIVDFNSFKHHILLKFWKGLSKLRGNYYLRILGGEYETLHNYVTKLVNDLKSLGIHLVFYIDGEKGSSIEALRQKFNTWKERHIKEIERMSQILNVMRQKTDINDLSWDTNINPVLLNDQLMATLRSCECEIHQSPAGEADLPIIRALRDRPKAFAILSNDSDFCVFKKSRLIPDDLFDIGNDLHLGEPRELPAKPWRLLVKVISTERVMTMLNLKEHGLLVEMSIVAGNDYTRPYMQKYIRHRTYLNNGKFSYNIDVQGGPHIQSFAHWIQTNQTAEEHWYLAKCMEMDPGFRQAVIHSRNFYNLRGEPDRCPDKGDFSLTLVRNVRSHRYALTYTALSFRWRSSWSMNMAVVHRNLVKLRTVENLQTFHRIWSHQEKGEHVNWFERHGDKNGFIVYILRYFLLLNWQQNLNVTKNEFIALVVMVIGHWDEKHYQAMSIRPSIRCVNIGNWMQDVYRHGYQMFGSVLHIRREFPLPGELFSGSVWAALYMVCQSGEKKESCSAYMQNSVAQDSEENERCCNRQT